MSRKCTVAEACPKLVREARASVIRLRVSIANLLEVVSYGMIRRRGSMTKRRRREKKKKHSYEYFLLDGLWRDHADVALIENIGVTPLIFVRCVCCEIA